MVLLFVLLILLAVCSKIILSSLLFDESAYLRHCDDRNRKWQALSRERTRRYQEYNRREWARVWRLKAYIERCWPNRELAKSASSGNGFPGRTRLFGLIFENVLDFEDDEGYVWQEYNGLCSPDGIPVRSCRYFLFKLFTFFTCAHFDAKGRNGSDSRFYDHVPIDYPADWRSLTLDWTEADR